MTEMVMAAQTIGDALAHFGSIDPPAEVDVDDRRPWHVVVSEPQRETMVAAGLVGYCFGVYLPTMLKRQRQNYDKFRTVRRPLFPSYVFTRFDNARDPWQRLFATRGVRGILMVGELPAIISDRHVDAIKVKEIQLAKDKTLYPVKVGDTVEIDDPLWMGQLGKIESLDDLGRISVLLSLFGREVSVKTSVGRVRQA